MADSLATIASREMSAADVAHSLICLLGWTGAHAHAHRHVLRCVEENLIDDAEFWMNIRNIVEHLMLLGPQDHDPIH